MNKTFKIILVIIDIIALIGFIIITINWFSDNNSIKSEEITSNNVTTREIKYKRFVFYIDNNIEYQEIDEKRFELISDDYHAIVEIFIDSNNYIVKDKATYYQPLQDNNYQVEYPYEINITNL